MKIIKNKYVKKCFRIDQLSMYDGCCTMHNSKFRSAQIMRIYYVTMHRRG